jgi:hypothetical protein
MTFDEIVVGLIQANIKNLPDKAILYYKNYEIDVEIKEGMTLKDVIDDFKRQIYETEKIPKGEVPSDAIEPLRVVYEKCVKLKSCADNTRRHINETAATVSEKAFSLEKMSYNLENKVDDLIMYLDELNDENN